MEKNPLPSLHYKNKHIEDLNREFDLLGVNFTDTGFYEAETNKLYPEGHASVFERIKQGIEIQRSNLAKQKEENVCVILVTHGFWVDDFSRICKGLQPEGGYCEFGSVSAVKFQCLGYTDTVA